MVVGNLVDELVEDDDVEIQENLGDHHTEKQDNILLAKEGIAEKEMPYDHLSSPSGDTDVVATSMRLDVQGDYRARDVRNSHSMLESEAQGSSSFCKPVDGLKITDGVGRHEGPNPNPPRHNRTNSFPLVRGCRREDILGLGNKRRGNKISRGQKQNVHRRRGGKDSYRSGDLRHRPPSEESTSSASVNNDWKHWVVMQGDHEATKDDVRGFGKALGLRFKGNSENKFSVLSRTRKDKQVTPGQAGLGGLEKRKEVRRMVGDQKPLFLCLQETKLHTCDVFLCSALWGTSPHDFSYRPSVGASGGLLSIWDSSEVEVWSTESRKHVLWCNGRFIKSGEEFYVANVYPPCDVGAKLRLWDSLSLRIQSLERQRVCVCGDFNAVKCIDERLSVRGVHSTSDHIPFNQFIDDNTLVNLPLSGRKFTWFKGDGLSMSRLDRFLLFEDWWLTWPNCMQEARMRGVSDHCPIILSADEEDRGPRPSRMLKCWTLVPGYNLFVRDKWTSFQVNGWGGFVLKEKLKMIKAAPKDCHTNHTQNFPSRIDALKVRQSCLDQKGEEDVLTEAELEEMHGVTSDIHSLTRLHASVCWQQSPSLWLKEGDANSKYFHSVLASRCGFAFCLVKPFRQDEVKAAVWDCESNKSPGPDGINFGFIKDFWPEMQGEVMRFIMEFHRNGKLTKGLNSTFIAMIPKVDSPQRLNDFRPISLVGCLYKILAKVLVNRLRLVIGSVISESQTAFVKDRQIIDGILIVNEVVDEARRSKKELMLFKVDFEKAYDSVDWGYLDAFMGRIPTDEFPFERGLRQGDPLSPFLFLLAAEGLNVLMQTMVERNIFIGYSVSEVELISISHLQFADDTLLLGARSWANVRVLRAVLMLFESMSGLKVNFNKSMLVGVNIHESWLGEAASALRCRVRKIPFIYIGLPVGGIPDVWFLGTCGGSSKEPFIRMEESFSGFWWSSDFD
ncbi:hypothetical protein TSUD_219040 [Trifolium subterraneum]|uniref:Reverse transcriptase domain-containing protein n=1 Tax=Trifolium subterraneum TaxID=3900 RepID=A0A2Z6MJ56_TRISU|nr:hypothetical protein TSUD_219040 [Trifolium subterraneum]